MSWLMLLAIYHTVLTVYHKILFWKGLEIKAGAHKCKNVDIAKRIEKKNY